jgi:hypothetical protein
MRLADRLRLPAPAVVAGCNQTWHQADIGFLQFAARLQFAAAHSRVDAPVGTD